MAHFSRSSYSCRLSAVVATVRQASSSSSPSPSVDGLRARRREHPFRPTPPPPSHFGQQEWRSTKVKPKRDYIEKKDIVLLSRTGNLLKDYLKLEPEARRREDLARQRLLREMSPDKLYALERERERILTINIDKIDRRAAFGIVKSSRAVFPTPRRSGNDDDSDSRHGAGRGVGKLLHSYDREKLVPGVVNRHTKSAPVRDVRVMPVVRGGAKPSLIKKTKRRPLEKVAVPTTIRLENMTNLLGVDLRRLQKAVERIGLGNSSPSRILTAEDASFLALEFNFDPVIDDEAAFDLYPRPQPGPNEDLPLRPPVTGIFGHVDHGKTSLLDALRATTVAAGEAGGITQHIGAFEVSVSLMAANLRARAKGQKVAPASPPSSSGDDMITFLDTPGHAAFTAMRERGAGVTDVVVLVVAADDGVKPQTEEVIGLIKSSDVGVVVAITKVDKPGVDTLKVKQSLMAAGVEIEEFGGDVPCVEVSSVTGQGLPELLETISAIAEVRELKAERTGRAEGRVLESRVEKGRGNVATVLVLRGCLRTTASIVAGTTWCRVRMLVSPSGKGVPFAFPGQPVEVTGWKDLPSAGDLVLEAASEDEAKTTISNRLKRIEQAKLWSDVEVINEKRRTDAEADVVRKDEEAKARARGLKGNAVVAAGNTAVESLDPAEGVKIKELRLIIKADVSGTVEAVVGALRGIGNSEAKVRIISSGVGPIAESDVEMARAVQGSIVGFNVKAPGSVLKLAASPPPVVPIHISPIIYRLVDTVRAAVADLLPKTIETRVHGEATILQIFSITVKGRKEPRKVAGCKVGNGVFQKIRKARVVRGGETIHVGTVSTLKQVKKDVLEVTKGVECGIALDDFEDYEVDDVIQSVELVEIARVL